MARDLIWGDTTRDWSRGFDFLPSPSEAWLKRKQALGLALASLGIILGLLLAKGR